MFRTGTLVTALLVAVAALLAAGGREAVRVRETGKGPSRAGGRIERCVSCHDRPDEDPGGVHSRDALGCAACHLGNPLAFQKERAHTGLEREPGALSTVAETCGKEGCHPREAARVASSLMARGSGIVGVDRWAFGEIPSPDTEDTLSALAVRSGVSPSEDHLRRLCAGCHLGTRRANRDDAIVGNGSGCSACHVARRREGERRRHPPVDSRIGDDRCFGCHSRSGRISLTYQGLFEVEPAQAAACEKGVRLVDGRPACRREGDVHLGFGMGCVDCHLHTELMGDTTNHLHEEDQVEVTCAACHGPVGPADETSWGRVTDPISRDLLRVRDEVRPPSERVRLGRRGTPIWNLRPDPAGKGWTLFRKSDGKAIPVKATPDDRNHRLEGHERLSCRACHSAWAPLCDSCHTAFDPRGKQWDFGAGREMPGRWTERSEGFGAGPPALGVLGGAIVPAVPGMVMSLELPGGGRQDTRLYAPAAPHSTGAKARTCASCHRPPAASLFGALPWRGTREGFRPFGPDERRKILDVPKRRAFRSDFLDSRRPLP